MGFLDYNKVSGQYFYFFCVCLCVSNCRTFVVAQQLKEKQKRTKKKNVIIQTEKEGKSPMLFEG